MKPEDFIRELTNAITYAADMCSKLADAIFSVPEELWLELLSDVMISKDKMDMLPKILTDKRYLNLN